MVRDRTVFFDIFAHDRSPTDPPTYALSALSADEDVIALFVIWL